MIRMIKKSEEYGSKIIDMIRMTNKNKYDVAISESFNKIAKDKNKMVINKTIKASQIDHMLNNIKVKFV